MEKNKRIESRESQEKNKISARHVKLGDITFKKPEVLKKFLSPRFKLLPSSKTGLSATKQRKLTDEIKKARILAILPFTDRHLIG